MQDQFEIGGQFYLGSRVDVEGNGEGGIYLYDSSQLTRHALCVGMTGSGKTGLCIDLLEEAAIDGIPAIVIDPKGDMTNLALAFNSLDKDSFINWISEEDAKREGMTREELAAKTAKTWKEGLNKWGQDEDRIRLLNKSMNLTIYTPASNSGRPISIASMGEYPGSELMADGMALADLMSSTVSDLLNLAGIHEDAMTSEKHVLLSRIIENEWKKGNSVSIYDLVNKILDPGIDMIGAMPLESFYPKSERKKLALTFNAIISSPSFEKWIFGDALDIHSLLYYEEAKPRVSIISINHLDDNGRMFFVSLLLNKLVEWMRRQRGTSSLRAIVYMDEIFGFFPPVANPPSKKPLLTLLKQARAYGLGLVLASQNPSDIDYKGLSNIGTWFIGRLNTKQDKERLLDGLEGVSESKELNREALSELISNLKKRNFIVNNVNSQGPEVIESRWAMSYLAGPLTEEQIKSLAYSNGNEGKRVEEVYSAKESDVSSEFVKVTTGENAQLSGELPIIDGVDQYILNDGDGIYIPILYAFCDVAYYDRSIKGDIESKFIKSTLIQDGPIDVDWSIDCNIKAKLDDMDRELLEGGKLDISRSLLNGKAIDSKMMNKWKRSLKDYIYRKSRYKLYKNHKTGLVSEVGESLADFKIRLDMRLREERDLELEKIRNAYTKKISQLEDRVWRAEKTLSREEDQAVRTKQNTLVNIGSAILDGILGRKLLSKTIANKAASAARAASRQREQAGDVYRAKEALNIKLEELESIKYQMEQDLLNMKSEFSGRYDKVEELELSPRKSDISIEPFLLLWVNKDGLEINTSI